MRKLIILSILVILLTSLASAEIIITQQPKEIYNLGEFILIPVTIKSTRDISNIFEMNLICNGHEINFYKNGVSLKTGEEKKIDPSLILTNNRIKGMKGDCVIKAILGVDYILTNEFKISDQINLHTEIDNSEVYPGENIIIKGEATKESGKDVDGFIQVEIFLGKISGNDSAYITQLNTITKGFFQINISSTENMAAGTYTIKLNAYEKDPLGEITNQGVAETSFLVKQSSTNLEILIENPEVEPGTNLKFKTILHDQTGQNIEALSTIKIKSDKDKLLEKVEIATDEFFEFPIKYNEPPAEFKIIATSNQITSETTFKIKEKEDIQIQIINKTLIIKNKGNVVYCNKTVLVKIGEESLNIGVCLDVDKEKKYILTAPDGEYQIEIITEDEKLTESVTLTGKAIDIKEVSGGVISLTRRPFIWIFVIGILGFMAFTIFKKGYKKSFIGYIHSKRKTKSSSESEKKPFFAKKPLIDINKAELSLSIKGDKQNASLVCLKIKNFKEVQSNPKNIQETLNKLIQIVKENKAVVYQNEENIFFILAPIKTKTFGNEKIALQMAQKIKDILTHHNKLFKQKIDFGLAINHGTIIAKHDKQGFEFMSFGNLITKSKRIASISRGEILLSEQIKDKLSSSIKSEKIKRNKIQAYSIKEIRNKKEHEKFIRSFLDRIEGKK